jgi:3-phosphoshikimate 1-carboxyvinyltransferase
VIVGDLVSRPYVQMTLDLLVNFGIEYTWEGNKIEIKHQSYQAKDIEVEADWSAASYWFEMAAFADNVDLKIKGLVDPSLQGDSVLRSWMQSFGVDSVYENGWMKLSKSNASEIPDQLDFILCPDIAQTFACVYAGLGKNAKFDGVQTLKIKETDRVQALQNELSKFGATIHVQNDAVFDIEGIVKSNDIAVDTYEDHRMAMSFAPLAMVMDEIIINEPMVVTKSYPKYWEDLKSVGFDIESL